MEFKQTSLPGVILIEPDIYRDERGFFLESWNAERYSEYIPDRFVQDNHSRSIARTLRGLHLQNPHAQGKLARVIFGSVFDVVVDVRTGSPQFGQWFGIGLSADNHRQLFMPPGFAHGFCVTSEVAEFEYKCTDRYHPEAEIVIAWDDPQLAIEWPFNEPVLSARDQQGKTIVQLQAAGILPTYPADYS